jgi:hypothetical protein
MRNMQQAARVSLVWIWSISLTFLAPSAAGAEPSIRLSTPAATNANTDLSWTPSVTDCEGNACAQIVLTWDSAKQDYKVQNTSQDQWVRVSAANLAASSRICIRPSGTAYLSLTSIVGRYQANYDTTCANL